VIFQQASFGVSQSLRELEDPVVVIRGECTDSLKQQFVALSGIQSVACTAQIPQYGLGMRVSVSPKDPKLNKDVGVYYDPVDFGFSDLIDVDFAAGRTFEPGRAAVEGFGITRVISYQVAKYLAEDKLKIVLADFEAPPQSINIVHREGRLASTKVRAFIDLIAARLRADKTIN